MIITLKNQIRDLNGIDTTKPEFSKNKAVFLHRAVLMTTKEIAIKKQAKFDRVLTLVCGVIHNRIFLPQCGQLQSTSQLFETLCNNLLSST